MTRALPGPETGGLHGGQESRAAGLEPAGREVGTLGAVTRRPAANPAASSLTWQLAVSNIDTCQRAGLNFEVAVERPRDDWTYRTIKLRSPNGIEVLLEEETPQP